MTEENLQQKISSFDSEREQLKEELQDLKKLQKKFVDDFTINKIKNLEIDDYVIGRNTHTSFCYRLERELDRLGTIRGATAPKFVVYYGHNGKDSIKDYRFTKKLGDVTDKAEALEKVKKEIVSLIEAGNNNDITQIKKNRLCDLFKYKILGTYFPDKHLNIYSHVHLGFFINQIGHSVYKSDILEKQNTLLDLKNSDAIMKLWTNQEFTRFLYDTIGKPTDNKEETKEIETLPPIEEVHSKIISLEISDYKDKKVKTVKSPNKIDYVKQQERNTNLGLRGEKIVFNSEEIFIKENKLPSESLEHVSLKDDTLGYDILSLDENGNKKYIEVKSTTGKEGDINFFISDNEKKQAETLENYYIYIVFEANTVSPKIWKIKEPFKKHSDKLKLTPVNYKVQLSSSKKK